jgi:alkylation response protein AidB-like acyl-CoA dehydrogenase
MNFGFSQEQDMLRVQARKFLEDQCPIPQVRAIAQGRKSCSKALWQQVADLGWLGLTVPEDQGGVGMDWVDLVVILEETGRSLFPSPFISTTLAATTISQFGTEPQQQQWLPSIMNGSCIATLALLDNEDYYSSDSIELQAETTKESVVLTGNKSFVQDAAEANLFLVAFRNGSELALALVAADQQGVSIQPTTNLDRTKPSGTVSLNEVSIRLDSVVNCGADGISNIIGQGALAVSAESIGVCEGILDMTAQYAKDRTQFGHPIGHFQGVKHPLADVYVDIECMKSLTYYAAWALSTGQQDSELAIARAKAYCSEKTCNAGVVGIQMHGAIGYTEEYDLQLYLKRSKWSRAQFGDEDFHYDRVAAMGGM